MQNHFNTVITQTPRIILECSEWIQYELEICTFPPGGVCEPEWLGCSLSAALGFSPVRSQRVRHRGGKSCLTAHSTSVHQKSETETFKNSHKELNSLSAQYMYLFSVWQAGQGLVAPSGSPCFGNGFCVSHTIPTQPCGESLILHHQTPSSKLFSSSILSLS